MNWNKITGNAVMVMTALGIIGFVFIIGYTIQVDLGETVTHGDAYEQMCNDRFGIEWEYRSASTTPWSDYITITCSKPMGFLSSSEETIKVPKNATIKSGELSLSGLPVGEQYTSSGEST